MNLLDPFPDPSVMGIKLDCDVDGVCAGITDCSLGTDAKSTALELSV